MMPLSPSMMIYGAIFLGVAVIIIGIYLLFFGTQLSSETRVNKRLDAMGKTPSKVEALAELRKDIGNAKGGRVSLFANFNATLEKSAIKYTIPQLIMIATGVSVVCFLLLTLASELSSALSLVLSFSVGIAGVYMWISKAAKKRMAMIEEQLPEAIELMVRSLRVGRPFTATIGVVAKEIPAPLGDEFAVIADEASYGRDIGEALTELAERLENQDMRFLAVAVTIQQKSGGDLAGILDGLCQVIRSRFKLFRRVHAITAEAKFSSNFLSSFPILATIGLNVIDPHYFDGVIDTPFFVPACLVVAGFVVVNLVVMRILVNIKV